MKIILTHEQADFDAIASLLGAHLLDERAIPVLPRRMNRNVRAFLTFYGIELPFIDPRDLPNQPIQAVTLVDTQSSVSIKGMGEDTLVQVIDHHPPRDELPAHWSITREDIGATTTLLVEAIRERDLLLTNIQATLLLLGIYEDTGSLTYTRTTSRDLLAASYLLDQGADLQIATDFLHHPLSQDQQALYDRLRDKLETRTINGHTIIIASEDAPELDEELSTIAHKLRDLMDADALFMLVTTKGGVQMIARSTSDNIDVAEILSHFGGGGHERAAAGLVREQTRAQIHSQLITLLPEYIHPAITVAQIMSTAPQVLLPSTPVDEAAARMQRYGYEGYPVVQEGKVVGLLTRRSVDKALAHNLDKTAGSLMAAGDYCVHPNDSIEKLQRVVADSGWGQIPVVDPESGEITGIVTRTDLLKTLSPQPKVPSQLNLASRLEATLKPARLRLLKAIAGEAYEKHIALYIVGGFVRDLYLNLPSQDFDLVVEGDAIVLAQALVKKYGGRTTSHARFGTAKWYLPESESQDETAFASSNLEFIDLVTARTEFYTYPSALPTVERGSIKLDLHRRDFTINTLAMRLDGHHYGELHDYWGGLNDLRQGLVRVLHSLSFVDDPTRMLRAVRFEQRFGFQIERRTRELMEEALTLLDRVSADRIRHELNHILVEEKAAQILQRLDQLNLLSGIHPYLSWDKWLQSRFESLPLTPPDQDWELDYYKNGQNLKRDALYALWMIRLTPIQAREAIARIKLPVDLTKSTLEACKLWHDVPELQNAPPSFIVTRLEDLPALSRYVVYLATEDLKVRKILRDYAFEWRKISPSITGHDLRARGLPPSPAYRLIISALRNAWLDGKISSEEEEAELLEQLIESTSQA